MFDHAEEQRLFSLVSENLKEYLRLFFDSEGMVDEVYSRVIDDMITFTDIPPRCG